jgi:hypothetical protein
MHLQLELILTTSDFLNEITSHYYILKLQVLLIGMNLPFLPIDNRRRRLATRPHEILLIFFLNGKIDGPVVVS